MFVRADRLLRGERPRWYSKHALWYYWKGFHPYLDLYDLERGDVEELDLTATLRRFDLSVSEERECVGSVEEGEYRPCSEHAALQGAFDQCRSCAGTWIPVQECIFEPRCAGDKCDSPLCRKRHVVYATFFGDLVKIGMTAGTRLRERAIEQGADAVARLAEFPNRLAAREAEKDISRRLRLPQRIRGEQIAEEMAKNPPAFSLKAKHERMKAALEDRYELLKEEVVLLDQYPGRELLMDIPNPRKVDAFGAHSGTMIGIKGRYLFYQDDEHDDWLMLPLADLPSRHLEIGGHK